MYTPENPKFYYIKVGKNYIGMFLWWTIHDTAFKQRCLQSDPESLIKLVACFICQAPYHTLSIQVAYIDVTKG